MLLFKCYPFERKTHEMHGSNTQRSKPQQSLAQFEMHLSSQLPGSAVGLLAMTNLKQESPPWWPSPAVSSFLILALCIREAAASIYSTDIFVFGSFHVCLYSLSVLIMGEVTWGTPWSGFVCAQAPCNRHIQCLTMILSHPLSSVCFLPKSQSFLWSFKVVLFNPRLFKEETIEYDCFFIHIHILYPSIY